MSEAENIAPKSLEEKTSKLRRPTPKLRVVRTKILRTREQSSIVFPYRDMDNAISVAEGMLQGGGVGLTSDQLAGAMGLQPGSGNFVLKVAAARIFGLISNAQGKYELSNLGFAIVDKEEKRQRAAKAEAFLTVPLFKRVYEEFRGKQLPPRPLGLEQALVKFGVSPKQRSTARLVLEKSATQAGFFSADSDRLIMPIIGAMGAPDRAIIQAGVSDSPRNGGSNFGGGGSPPSDGKETDTGRHPFIQGLLRSLPAPDTNWTIEGRAKWLQAAANIFDLMYKGSGEIHVTAKAEEPRE